LDFPQASSFTQAIEVASIDAAGSLLKLKCYWISMMMYFRHPRLYLHQDHLIIEYLFSVVLNQLMLDPIGILLLKKMRLRNSWQRC